MNTRDKLIEILRDEIPVEYPSLGDLKHTADAILSQMCVKDKHYLMEWGDFMICTDCDYEEPRKQEQTDAGK